MYKIAGLNVSVSNGGALFDTRARPYRTDSGEAADLVIDLPRETLRLMHSLQSHLTEDQCAYIYTGEEFSSALVHLEGFKLHASAVVLDKQAYLFSAPSGTGKSTHTALWCDYFGPERAYILNDDMPVVKWSGDGYMAWGSPWSGTSPLSRNAGALLKAIAFLERSDTDWIEPMISAQSIIRLMEETRRSREPGFMMKLMALLERLLETVPIYRLGCTMSFHAVQTAYGAMSK